MQECQDTTVLELKQLTKHFGGLAAVENLDLDLMKGEIFGLIGPNGAGKSTVFNLVNGLLKPTRGKVIFNGEDITNLKPDQIARRRLARVFQASVLIQDFTVIENVIFGRHIHSGSGFFRDLLNMPSSRLKQKQVLESALEIVRFVGLSAYGDELAKNLAHGHQRALGIGIALAVEPELLMLDEPVTGMNVKEKESMTDLIARIQAKGITVLLVEHDMKVVMGICHRIAVLNFGEKIAEGSPDEIRSNHHVIEAYLGADDL
jgi:branched-chain amino acid transport system ATP-binding protein